MELVYADDDILVCLKPARVLSTDEPGGVPDLCREALGEPKADVRTVHRLDRVVAGLMCWHGMPRLLPSCPVRFGRMNLRRNTRPLFMDEQKHRRPFGICWAGTRRGK